MTEEDLQEYKIKLAEDEKKIIEELEEKNFSKEEINKAIKQRDLQLKGLSDGTIQGPNTGFASIDKQWLKYFEDEQILSSMPNCSIYEYIYERNKDNLNKSALEYFGNQITYKDFFDNIEKAQKVLINNGIGYGDVVAMSMPTTPETVYLLYALSKIGAVANMIDPRTSESSIAEYLNESNAKIFIGIDAFADKFINSVQNTSINKIILTSPLDSLPLALKTLGKIKQKLSSKKYNDKKIVSYESEVKEVANLVADLSNKGKGESPVVIVHTGGTTGKSKGVILSNNNLNSSVKQSEFTGQNMISSDTWMNIMPPFIAYGASNGLHLPLSMGMKVVLIPQFNPNKFADLLIKHKPQHMAGVPSHYENIIHSKKMKNFDLSFLKMAIVGGDSMDPELEKETNEFLKNHNAKIKILKGYGMSEATAAVALPTNNPLKENIPDNNKLKSVGVPFSHTNIGVFEYNTEKELPIGEIGELCFNTPNAMIGYLNNEEETEHVLKTHKDGKTWIHSGDLGYMDKDGNIYIMDRVKRVIIRHDGFKIFPSVIENLISTHSAVEACKVIGVRDYTHVQGKLPKAYIVVKPEYENQMERVLEEINEMCNKDLSEYFLPITFEFRKSLPLTPVGKIDYKKLEEENEQLDQEQNQSEYEGRKR